MDIDIIFDSFRDCITEQKCKDCPWIGCKRFKNIPRVQVPVDLCLAVLSVMKRNIHDSEKDAR